MPRPTAFEHLACQVRPAAIFRFTYSHIPIYLAYNGQNFSALERAGAAGGHPSHYNLLIFTVRPACNKNFFKFCVRARPTVVLHILIYLLTIL
jgi:hypothetical protein